MNYEFRPGDNVVWREGHNSAMSSNRSLYDGLEGVVCHIHPTDYPQIGVRWDIKVQGGHNCNHTCEKGFGWYVNPEELEVTEARGLPTISGFEELL